MTSTISVMHPTINGEPPHMFGLTDRPLPVCCDTPHCYYVRGYEHTVGVTLPDLQNRWRRIASNPRAFVDEAIAGAKAELDRLAHDDPDDESETVARELYTFRVVRLLLDHAVENQKRLPPTLTTVDFDAAILALPNVTRVRRHGSILRVLVDIPNNVAPPNERIPPALEAYHRNEALLHLARLVAVVVHHNEIPNQLSVHLEPGELPDGYELRKGEAVAGDRRWPVYSWRKATSLEVAPSHLTPASAIDDAWDHFAAEES